MKHPSSVKYACHLAQPGWPNQRICFLVGSQPKLRKHCMGHCPLQVAQQQLLVLL